MRILVADDNEDARLLLRTMLESGGYTVETASSGVQALELLRRSPPDMIISDILMPEMDGYTLCRKVKTNAQLNGIPFVFYTATYVDPRDERLAMALGASRFILKALEPERFIRVVEEVLGEYQQRELPVPEQPREDEETLERMHAETLARQLDKKVQQLEKERRALRSAQSSLLEAQRIAHLGNWSWSIETGELHWSDEIYRIFGLEPQEFHATYEAFLERVHPDDRQAIRDAIDASIANHTPYSIEHRLVRSDGTVRIVHERGEVTYDAHGNPIRMIGTVHDITDRKQAEAQVIQAAKLATLGEMATGVAHELNQPLVVIRMAASNILKKQQAGSVDAGYLSQKLERIASQTERAAAIIDHLRNFGRKASEEPTAVDVIEMLHAALDLMEEQLRPTAISVSLDIPAGCRAVRGHRIQMEQVILNLLINARDAIQGNTPNDAGKISVALVDSDPDFLRVTVQDTGGGIPEAMLDRLFDPFFTTKLTGRGTGLGLSVSYAIVRNMGGTITVRNVPGGACFTITLPVMESP